MVWQKGVEEVGIGRDDRVGMANGEHSVDVSTSYLTSYIPMNTVVAFALETLAGKAVHRTLL